MVQPHAPNERVLGQNQFLGGMNMLNPGPTEYFEGINLVIRDGYPTTRPGVRRHLRHHASALVGFYFNADNEKYNDATHLGFWFPFAFVASPWGDIQGANVIRLDSHDENKVIFASGGAVYIYENGYVETIATSPAITSTAVIDFVQANDLVYLFQGEDVAPLYWDGGTGGFIAVPAAAVGDDIPNMSTAVYFQGRMWGFRDQHDVYASAVLDFTEWDYTERNFGIEEGDKDELTALVPFHEDTMLVFKKNTVWALTAVNAIIESGADLTTYVYKQPVDLERGALASKAIARVGEDVWYLGYGGIYSLRRNQENKLERQAVPVSTPIQPWVDRINWDYANVSCATVHDNYVIFAVPIDGSTTNNCMLVWDVKLQVCVGIWQGTQLNPVRFFHNGKKLIFLSVDNIVREMFTDDPTDTDMPYEDTPDYAAAKQYRAGDLVYYETVGRDAIYRALDVTLGNLPTDTDYWEEVTDDIQYLYHIKLELELRMLEIDDHTSMAMGTMEAVFQHQNPKLTLSQRGRDYGTEEEIFTEKEYPQAEYDTADVDDWDETNENLDFGDPYRKDYTLLVDDAGMYIGSDGIEAGIWETHALQFIPAAVGDRALTLRFENTQGKIRIRSVGLLAEQEPFAMKEVA